MRTKVIDGVNFGYHDQMNRNDPGDSTGLSLLAMCLMQQAGIEFSVDETEAEELEAFEFNGLGIYIRWMGKDYFLRTTALANEDELFNNT
jgi:hypothetical protein